MITGKVAPALQLSVVFLLFGSAWIFLTDMLSLNIARRDSFTLAKMQTYKGILFMVIAAILIYLVSRNLFARQLRLQHQLSEERVQYKTELGQEVFRAQEAERRKIGQELHDNINQLLGVVKLYIEHARNHPDSKDDMLQKSSEYLMQVIDEIRALSRSLVSTGLSEVGLRESIGELVGSIEGIRNLRITIHDRQFSEDALTDIQKLMLFRIVQEQLNNILKHSHASEVEIELKRLTDTVYLTVKDNGVGFDPRKAKNGLGFYNIRHRLQLFNGRLKLDSYPGQGCRLEAVFKP